jgi:hypothetical protein
MSEYDDKNPELKNSVVCFIDILGFREISERAFTDHKGNDLLAKLNKIISKNIDHIKLNETYDKNIKIFTDNIVIGIPIYDDGELELGHVLRGFGAYQLSFALKGFFVRGAIDIGKYYCNDNIAFGPALIQAHKLESKEAVYPRIILSNEACNYLENHIKYYGDEYSSPQNQSVLIYRDGKQFINYLDEIFILTNKSDQINILKRHKKVIQKKLKMFENNHKVVSKYLWVSDYHDYFCQTHFSDEDHLIIGDNFKDFSRIIDWDIN